jgi:hypothetical protein
MTEETMLAALRSNVKLGADQEMFYMRVHWQMEREREIAIQRGRELDVQLKKVRAEVPNVK